MVRYIATNSRRRIQTYKTKKGARARAMIMNTSGGSRGGRWRVMKRGKNFRVVK